MGAILARGHAGAALEQAAEEADIVIADLGADRLDRLAAAFEHRLGGLDPERLDIGGRHSPGRGLEAAREGALAHAGALGKRTGWQILAEILLEEGLDRPDLLVVMGPGDRKDRIAGLEDARHW